MGLEIDNNGNIFIYKGDSGDIVLNGLPTDKNYKVYFMIKDLKGNNVAERLEVQSNFKASVNFFITSDFSDMLTVPKGEEFGLYYYGIKTVDDENIDTLFVKGSSYGKRNKVIVFPKKVEV